MKKRVVLALMMALVLALTSGCKLIVKDPEVDKQTVVLDVNGTTYTKGEVQLMVEDELAYQEYLYVGQYGMELDVDDPEIVAQVQDIVVENIVWQTVLEQKLAEGGYLDLSDEELAQVQADAEENYQSYIDLFVTNYFADSELSEEEKRAAAEERMIAEGGYPTREELLENEKLMAADEKFFQEVIADVTVSDEEVQAAYDERVAAMQADYEANPYYYDMDVNDGATIYYNPAGYRYVKHILLMLPEAEQNQLDELDAQIQAKQGEISALQASVDVADATDKLEEELAALQLEYDAVRTAAFDNLQMKVDEVQAKITEGQDFDALIQEYGEDPGMTVEPAMCMGYLIGYNSTDYVASFQEAAMALTNVGDVSEPVESEYGIHLIKYVSEVEEGPAPFADVQEQLTAEVLATKQNEAYQMAVDAWVNEADVKFDQKSLMD